MESNLILDKNDVVVLRTPGGDLSIRVLGDKDKFHVDINCRSNGVTILPLAANHIELIEY